MSYKKTMQGVKYLVQNELDMACEENGNSFSSNHEAYAVILEEEEEMWNDALAVERELDNMWRLCVTKDQPIGERLVEIEKHAIQCACEAIQVAAMARKAM